MFGAISGASGADANVDALAVIRTSLSVAYRVSAQIEKG